VELDWVAEVWVDPDWYAEQESTDPMPSPGLPTVVPLRKRSILIGRTSHSRNIAPDIACETDTGISRRQAQLTTDGTRWFVEDLDSANGTFVAPASGPVPPDPIAVGAKRELAPDDRIYLGAWTRVVVRSATDDEKSTL
jgi:pSer/pThr/pTyr-binding forkhead associated (FHA) protein